MSGEVGSEMNVKNTVKEKRRVWVGSKHVHRKSKNRRETIFLNETAIWNVACEC